MAITVGVSSQNNGNSSSVDLPIPTHASGDLLLAWFECTGQAIGTTPAGWTLVATTVRGNVYTRFDTAGTLTGTASWGLTASNRWAGGITAFTGVDPAIWDLGNPVITGDTTTALVLPGITPPDSGTVLVTGFANSSPTSTGPVPAGWTQQYYITSSGVAALATKAGPAAGSSTGDVTWTQSLSRACGGFLGALKPASITPPATSTTGTLPQTTGLTGVGRTLAAAAGALALATGLAGTASTVATTTGTLRLGTSLTGSASTTARAAGALPVNVGLSAAAFTPGGGTTTGTLPIGVGLTPVAATAASSSGALPSITGMLGASSTIANGAGDLPITVQLVGAASGTATTAGSLPVHVALVGTVSGGQPPRPARDITVTASPITTSWAAGTTATNPISAGTTTGSPQTAGPTATTWAAGPVTT